MSIRRLCAILAFATVSLSAFAKVPKWYKSARNSVFEVIAYNESGEETARSRGFFIDKNGTGITDLEVLTGAYSAITVDAAGIRRPINVILGADDIYDAVRFQVTPDKKLCTVKLSSDMAEEGNTVTILPYSSQKLKELPSDTVTKSMGIDGGHHYYNIDIPFDSSLTGCPVFDDGGHVIGIVQDGQAADKITYVLDAGFTADLRIMAMSLDTKAYTRLNIRKALPEDPDQALAYIFIKQNAMGTKEYGKLLEDFMLQFPDNADGMFNLGSYLIMETDSTQYARGIQLIEQSIQTSDEKDRMHCDYASLIYTSVTQGQKVNDSWTLDKALEEIDTALAIDTVPVYYQLKGNIEYAMKRYNDAYRSYCKLNRTNMASADTYLYTYTICRQMDSNPALCISLLDSAIVMMGTPMPQRAGTLIIERAMLKQQAGLYRDAVNDYNAYENLIGTNSMNESFFYTRHQVEIQAKMYEQALADINMARQLAPQDSTLMLEHASLLLRINNAKAALPLLEELVITYPDSPDVQRLLGVSYLRLDNKEKAFRHIGIAADLGDSVAKQLLDQATAQ